MYKQILKKTYKYRLYPTERQQDILEKQLSLCRWLYNHFLEERKTLYEKSKTKITCFDQIREIPELKKGKPELGEVYSQTLQDVVRRLDKAFQNFFRRVKKNKNGEKQNPGYPRYLIKSEEKLSQIQRWHSRKKLKSNNRSKSRLKVAKLHEKITNQRIDFLHKLSHKLVKNFRLIAFEKLNIKGMTKNKYLAKSIIDTSWAHFLQQLTYKAAEAGVWAVGVNPKNTTQVCSGCKNIVPKTLATRKHKCPLCGLTIDRDVNAARNILQLALDTVGTTEINACGVRRILPTMKQEATGFNRW